MESPTEPQTTRQGCDCGTDVPGGHRGHSPEPSTHRMSPGRDVGYERPTGQRSSQGGRNPPPTPGVPPSLPRHPRVGYDGSDSQGVYTRRGDAVGLTRDESHQTPLKTIEFVVVVPVPSVLFSLDQSPQGQPSSECQKFLRPVSGHPHRCSGARTPTLPLTVAVTNLVRSGTSGHRNRPPSATVPSTSLPTGGNGPRTHFLLTHGDSFLERYEDV